MADQCDSECKTQETNLSNPMHLEVSGTRCKSTRRVFNTSEEGSYLKAEMGTEILSTFLNNLF